MNPLNPQNQIKVGSPLMYKFNNIFESPLTNLENTFSYTSPGNKLIPQQDRFISSKVSKNLNTIFATMDDTPDEKENVTDQDNKTLQGQNESHQQQKISYSSLLQTHILKKHEEDENLLFKQMDNMSLNQMKEKLITRKIPKQPYKVLEAPALQDDFYLNLLDWSENNFLSVGLENEVYIWSACTSRVNKLCEFDNENDMVCSVSWSHRGNHLAVGNNFGDIQIFDVTKHKLVRTIDGHNGRIGSLAWNGYLLASGSRDRNILVRDVRIPLNRSHQNTNFDFGLTQQYIGHKQEICGLRWSYDEQYLASGGNDNKLFIWSLKKGGELTHFSQHTAAVKALGWSPHQHNILASGGGTADRCIRFFNMHTLTQQDFIDTGSQVCNLSFSKTVNEIISTHGYSLNQINLWKYPKMQKVATLTGHTLRVLYLAVSPCGINVVTGAGDQTLRFWQVWPGGKQRVGAPGSSLCPQSIDLR